MTLGLHFWLAPLQALALVASLRLGLRQVRINLVSMQKMQESTFLVLMDMKGHGDVAKTKRASPYPFCISYVINKFSDGLMFLFTSKQIYRS